MDTGKTSQVESMSLYRLATTKCSSALQIQFRFSDNLHMLTNKFTHTHTHTCVCVCYSKIYKTVHHIDESISLHLITVALQYIEQALNDI